MRRSSPSIIQAFAMASAGAALVLVPHTVSSVHPSSANSAARSGASPIAKNSSSCGGATDVPDSIACACPRWWISCWNRCISRRSQRSVWTRSSRWICTMRSRRSAVSASQNAIRRRSIAACAAPQAGDVRIRNRIAPGPWPERSALHRIDVKQIDHVDVVQGLLQARKEAGAFQFELGPAEFGAGGEQPVIGPGVVMGERAKGLDEIGGHERAS